MVSIGHLALFVNNLRAAETFYRHIFDMQLIMREAPKEDGLWYTLHPAKGWEDAEVAGIDLAMVALKHEGFVLALFQGRPSPEETVLEIGLIMKPDEIAAVRKRLPDSIDRIYHPDDFIFHDPFGYRWHLWLEDNEFLSNGESSGRWLEI
jgi:hypothetical protein